MEIKENSSAAGINNNAVGIKDEAVEAVASDTTKIEAIFSEAVVNTRVEKAEVGGIKTENEASIIIKTEANTGRVCPIRALKITPSSISIKRARNRALELNLLKDQS